MDAPYVLAPFLGWVLAGGLKFVVNSARSGRLAFDRIGYGGIPSTHTTIVATTAALVGLESGWHTPGFAIALTLAVIVVIDALGLRRHIGLQAAAINELRAADAQHQPLRETMGHRLEEVGAGIALGCVGAFLLHLSFARLAG